MDGLGPAEGRRVKASFVKGWSPPDGCSGDTHADGCAGDFATGGWPDALVRKVVALLQSHGCRAVLRLPGEDLGPGVRRVGTEHLHGVLDGHGNAAALAAVTAPGGTRHLERQIAKRRRGR